jgi:uncharacterized protein YecE (DUF72 family)
MITRGKFFSGLSGIHLPVPKYQFPVEFQKASRLNYYASHFNSIEVNSSFYKLPMQSTVAKWVADVPENFKFTFKLSKSVTHEKELNFDIENIDKFIQSISPAFEKAGCILVQFPPSLTTSSIHQLDLLLHRFKLLNTPVASRVAVEFRNRNWYNTEVFDLLESYEASVVMHDIPKSATPRTIPDGHTIYLRFHGPAGNYKGSYTDVFLEEQAGYIKEWLTDGKSVYTYFNNTNGGDAFPNLVKLNKFVCGE